MDDIPFIPLDTIDIHWKAISYTHTRSLPASLYKTRLIQLKDARWDFGGSRLWD